MVTEVQIEPYTHSHEHILSHLALLDLRLLSEVYRLRGGEEANGRDEFQGMLVAEKEIDGILKSMPFTLEQAAEREEPLAEVIDFQTQLIEERTRISLDANIELRLEALRRDFGLSEFEQGLLMICIAPEMDMKYEKLYAYIQEDVSKRRPTVNMAINLFCKNMLERFVYRNALVDGSALLEQNLVELTEDNGTRSKTLLSSFLEIDQRVSDYLLGADALDPRLKGIAELVESTSIPWDEVVLPDDVKAHLVSSVTKLSYVSDDQTGSLMQLVGAKGSGKKTIAKAMCQRLQRNMLLVDIRSLTASDISTDKLLSSLFREAKLQKAVVCFDDFHVLLEQEGQHQSVLAAITREIGKHRDLTFVLGEKHWRIEGQFPDHIFLTQVIPSPDFSERQELWQTHLSDSLGYLTEDEINALAGRFRLQGDQIRKAVATARDRARFREDSEAHITVDDLNAASRWHSNQNLGTLAQKLEPRYAWDDIVLPKDQKQQLQELCNYFDNMALVYGQWGFQRKTNLGKGLNALFAGSSGTGKTMAADIMAGQLGLDVYKIDLSSIISKYIGETEKNLDKIFQEANDSNAILFFDEADSLFGKRSEVRDSHDRYANIEVSYLLQKMEEYQGIVILATNFRKNMDDAFVRRMHFVVEFPVPEEKDRLEIWKRVFPPEAPQGKSVDLPFIAKQFKLAGGNIKNIAVTSAFLAAQDASRIEMEHLVFATKREYQKMGKLLIESEFGKYFDLVRSEVTR